jgi:phosphoserine phosphatase
VSQGAILGAKIRIENLKVSRNFVFLFGENSMDQSTVPSRPLCVDMDGTLLEIDTMEDLIVSFLRSHFWQCWKFGFWILRGRAHFKRRLAEEAVLRVASLPAHPEFVHFLEGQHGRGRTLVLVSAADERIVQLVAERFKFFSRAIGSDGETNLRGEAKLRRLTELFGPKGFDYAGNSSVDFPVWQGAAEAIIVNARSSVEHRARQIANVTRTFPKHTGRLELLRQLLRH